MSLEILLDPETGEVKRVANEVSSKPPGAMWKVICNDGAVSVIGATSKSKAALLGSAKWTGKKLENRYEPDDAINSKKWQHIAEALYGATHHGGVVDEPPAEPATPLDPAAALQALDQLDPSQAMAALDQPAPEPVPAKPEAPPRDRRSGWWAFAAMMLAVGAAIVSWIAMPSGDSIALVVTIALGVVALGLVIYTLYGATTRCPRCKAWYRRDHTSTDSLGTHTTTRQISHAVKDSSGKQIGTTYETATYEVESLRYRYKCKECSNTWTGSGSRERRIS